MADADACSFTGTFGLANPVLVHASSTPANLVDALLQSNRPREGRWQAIIINSFNKLS